MFEAFSIPGVTRFVKIVHVELSDEAGEVVVLEVSWENCLSKLIRLVDYKTGAI